MLIEIYIEALLADEKQADLIWQAWDIGQIDDLTAYSAWLATSRLTDLC